MLCDIRHDRTRRTGDCERRRRSDQRELVGRSLRENQLSVAPRLTFLKISFGYKIFLTMAFFLTIILAHT